MKKKNHYRVVLNAVLKLPWLEGLACRAYLDNDNLCCAVGAGAFGNTPQRIRKFDSLKLRNFRLKIGYCTEDNIASANDVHPGESPLDRKHRMIVWLRERADAADNG